MSACNSGGSDSSDPAGASGTANLPVEISAGQSTQTSVSTGDSYYVVSGLATGQFYAVHAYALTGNIALYGYVDASFMFALCSSDQPGTADEACSTTPDANGKIYIRVSGANTGSGASFKLQIMPAAAGQGSLAAPLDITAALPYSGIAGHVAESYYVINNLTPGQMYTVALGSVLYNPALDVYQRKQFDTPYCSSDNAVWIDESCPVAANFEGKLYIHVAALNDTLSHIGAYYNINVTPASGTELVFQGYSDAPIDITGMLPYASQVNRFSSYYKLTGLTPGTRYEVRMNTPTLDLPMSVFPTGSYANAGCTAPQYFTLPARKSCVIAAPGSGELYLQVSTFSTGGTYTLDVVLAPVAEGSLLSPKVISATYDGQVDGTTSYYVINGLNADWNYTVMLSNASNSVSVMAGASTNLNPYTDIGTGRTNGSGSLFIKVDGSGTNSTGAWFTLTYAAANNPQGSLVAPVDITSSSPSLPHAGQVDNRTSYYKMSGLTSGSYYMTHVGGGYTQEVTVYVWDTSSYSGTAKCWFTASPTSSAVANHCLAPAPGSGTFYIEVRGPSSILGTQFTLWLAPSLLTSEGQGGAPINITPSTPYAGKVSNYTTDRSSYYVVSGLPGNTAYTVALADMSDDANLTVFSDSGLSAELCRSMRAGLYDESCVATTVAGGGSNKTLYLRVDASTSTTVYDGARYTLTVTPGGTSIISQGTVGTPLDITASLPYSGGKVRVNEHSYYKVTGLTPGARYAVIAENPNDAVYLYAYSNAAFSTVLCADASWFTPVTRSCSTTPNSAGELFLKVSGLSASDATYTLKLLAAPLAQGTSNSPIDITSLLPYAGQVNGAKSFYMVAGLTPGAAYHLSASNLTQKVQINAYSDSAFSNLLAQGRVDEAVSSTVAAANSSGILYIAVDGAATSDGGGGYHGAFFNLTVRAAPRSEGSSGAPVMVTQHTPYAGQKTYLGNINSYYKVSGLSAHSSHRVSLRNRSMSAWIKIYDSASFTRELCYSGDGDYRTGCAAAANSAGEIYIQAGGDGGFYDIYVP